MYWMDLHKRWVVHFKGIKKTNFDVLFVVFETPSAVHVFSTTASSTNSTRNGKRTLINGETLCLYAPQKLHDIEAAAAIILKKLVYGHNARYLARFDIDAKCTEMLDAALARAGKVTAQQPILPPLAAPSPRASSSTDPLTATDSDDEYGNLELSDEDVDSSYGDDSDKEELPENLKYLMSESDSD
jgi:hypothetical protein